MQPATDHVLFVHDVVFAAFVVGWLLTIIVIRSARVRRCAFLSIAAAAGLSFWLATPAIPATSSVNGTYRSPCCGPILLRNGFLIAGNDKVPFTLHPMKYGLDAELNAPIEVSDREVVSYAGASTKTLSFGDDGKSFTVCAKGGCGQSKLYRFVRS